MPFGLVFEMVPASSGSSFQAYLMQNTRLAFDYMLRVLKKYSISSSQFGAIFSMHMWLDLFHDENILNLYLGTIAL